jgi:hypothetical protein
MEKYGVVNDEKEKQAAAKARDLADRKVPAPDDKKAPAPKNGRP